MGKRELMRGDLSVYGLGGCRKTLGTKWVKISFMYPNLYEGKPF